MVHSKPFSFRSEDDCEPCCIMCGGGDSSWLERRTRDWKVAGSNPCRNGGRIFFSRVDFLCWLLLQYLFHPCFTAVACKRTGHSAKSAGGRLQLNTHTPYICGFAWSDMVVWCTQNSYSHINVWKAVCSFWLWCPKQMQTQRPVPNTH